MNRRRPLRGRRARGVPRVCGDEPDPTRAEYLPLLDDLLTDPWEVWVSLERHIESGYYELRTRLIKGYAVGTRGRGLLLVAQQAGGFLESWTFLPVRQMNYLQSQRAGKLWHGS